jgi:hypothetical protein
LPAPIEIKGRHPADAGHAARATLEERGPGFRRVEGHLMKTLDQLEIRCSSVL